MKVQGDCIKRHDRFEEHTLHWWCFFLPKHYPHTREYECTEEGEIESSTDTPLHLLDAYLGFRKGKE